MPLGCRWEEAAELSEDEIKNRLFPELLKPLVTLPFAGWTSTKSSAATAT